MVEHVDYTYDGRVYRGYVHSVYYTMVSCNLLTPFIHAEFVVQLVPRLTVDTWRRAIRLR